MYITQGNRKSGLKIAYVDKIDLLWIEIAPKRVIFGSTGALRGNWQKIGHIGVEQVCKDLYKNQEKPIRIHEKY